jgi:hypothetical protein
MCRPSIRSRRGSSSSPGRPTTSSSASASPGRIAPVQGQQQPLQRRAQPGVDAADGSEVQQAELAVGQQQDVARVRVGVEGALQHDLAEQAVQQAAVRRGAHVGGCALVDRGQRPPVQALHHQHPGGAQRPVRNRDGDAAATRRSGDRGHVACLYPQVELLAQGGGESGGQPDGADRPAPAGAAFQPGRQPPGDIQVPVYGLADVGAAYLDHDPGPGHQGRRVDLGDRRGGDRLGVEAGEQLADLSSQFRPQHVLDRGPRDPAASSCRRLSSAVNSAGRRSRRVDSICPSLTKVTPPSSMASRTERASRARPPGVASSDRRPPRAYGSSPRRARILLICQ